MLRSVALFMLVLFAQVLSGQENLRFNSYNITDGLSHSNVNCLYQDDKGFIWIGTDNGLNRFDGIRFQVFNHEKRAPNSVCGNIITTLFEDDDGILWVGTADGGLCYYDAEKEDFIPSQIPPLEDGTVAAIITMGQEPDGRFWVSLDQLPLYYFYKDKPEEGAFEQTTNPDHARRSYAFYRSPNGDFYAGKIGFGVVKRSGNFTGKDLWREAGNGDSLFYPGSVPTAITEWNNNIISGGWDNEILSYDPAKDNWKRLCLLEGDKLSTSGNETRSLLVRKDQLWIGTKSGGLIVYDFLSQEKSDYLPLNYDQFSLLSARVNCLIEDADKRVWLGTDKGLSVYDPKQYQFETVYLGSSIPASDGAETVHCFQEYENELLIGTQHGLWKKNKHGSLRFEHIVDDGDTLQVHSLFVDSKKRLWIGTNKTLLLYRGEYKSPAKINTLHGVKRKSLSSYFFFNLSSSRIMDINEGLIDGHNYLISVAYGYGPTIIDLESLSGVRGALYIENDTMAYSSVEHLCHRIYVNKDKVPWFLGTNKGALKGANHINAFNHEKSIKNMGYAGYVNDQNNFPYLYAQNVPLNKSFEGYEAKDLLQCEDGSYLLSTYDHGLHRLIEKDDSVHVTAIDSPNSTLESMAFDADSNLWVISSSGLDRLDAQNQSWQRFDYRDGFPETGVAGSIMRLSNGRMVAAGNGYFVEFDPKAIKINDAAPSIFINSLKLMNEERDSLLQVNDLELNYMQNALEFGFTALNLTNAEMNRYSYKLEGVDQDWVDAGSNAFARYADLSGGDYTFKVKAANNHGVWNKEPAIFSFSIVPPFWKRWWFYPLISLLAIAVGIALYRLRVNNLHKQQMEKLKAEVSAQEKERSRLAQDLHDDLGTKMSALKLYLNTLELSVGTEHAAQPISKNAQELLDESIGDLRSMLNNLSPKIVREFGYFSASKNLADRLSATGAIHIVCNFDVENERFGENAELALYRVTQELIHNAIKHADCQRIDLSAWEENGFYKFRYVDDGKGFEQHANHGAHYGLANIRNRIQIVQGTLRMETKPGAGLSVYIDLPMRTNHHA